MPSQASIGGLPQARMSTSSLQSTAWDVCQYVYCENADSDSPDTLDRYYEPTATYENPVLTATSRSMMTDIFKLSRQLSVINIPRPIVILCALFRLKPPDILFSRSKDQSQHSTNDCILFEAVRAWTDIGDVCEHESFDGHRKCMVEHTLNVLFLPNIHRDWNQHSQPSSDSLISNPSPPPPRPHHITAPSLPVFGTSLSLPSPFHYQLHIISRLSFNEQGRITHHRDFWDVKDVMGLVPGVSLAQWITSRITAVGLSHAARLCLFQRSERPTVPDHGEDLESARRLATPPIAYKASVHNALGLEGL